MAREPGGLGSKHIARLGKCWQRSWWGLCPELASSVPPAVAWERCQQLRQRWRSSALFHEKGGEHSMNASHYHPHSSDERRDKSAIIGSRRQDFPPLGCKGHLLPSQTPGSRLYGPRGLCLLLAFSPQSRTPITILTFVCSLK